METVSRGSVSPHRDMCVAGPYKYIRIAYPQHGGQREVLFFSLKWFRNVTHVMKS